MTIPSISVHQISTGDAGIHQTIAHITKLVDQYSMDWELITLSRVITRTCPPKDKRAEADALFWWVKKNVKFVNDPVNAELLQNPKVTLQQKAGDCDDLIILLATLNQTIGNEVSYVVISRREERDLTHIFLAVFDRNQGQWTAYDPAVIESYPGWIPPKEETGRIRVFYSATEYEDYASLSGWFSDAWKKIKKVLRDIEEAVRKEIKRNPIYKEAKRLEERVRKEKDRFLTRVASEVERFEKKIGPFGKLLLMGPLYMMPGNPLSLLEFAKDPSLANMGNLAFGGNPWDRLTQEDWDAIGDFGGVSDMFKTMADLHDSLVINPVKIYTKMKEQGEQARKEIREEIAALKKLIDELKAYDAKLLTEQRAKREALAKLEKDYEILTELETTRAEREKELGLMEIDFMSRLDEFSNGAKMRLLEKKRDCYKKLDEERSAYLEIMYPFLYGAARDTMAEIYKVNNKVNQGQLAMIFKGILEGVSI